MSNFDLIIKDAVIGATDVAELRKIAGSRSCKVLWCISPTCKLHFGHYIPILKIAELVNAGCIVTILISDLQALLEGGITEQQIKYRSEYYTKALQCMLGCLKIDVADIRFINGSSFQLESSYTKDLYRLNADCTYVTVKPLIRGETVSSILCPAMQALDEEYLQADIRMWSDNQIDISKYARDYLPKIGYTKRIDLFTKNYYSEFELTDLRSKIKKGVDGKQDIIILGILADAVFPLLRYLRKKFVIYRHAEQGGSIIFDNYSQLKDAYYEKALNTVDLRSGLADNIDFFVEHVRKEFESRDLRQILKHSF